MRPTSDERREVAKRLRHMADAHDATEASRVAHALELEYKVYGTVVAFDSADIWNLADLIDPTCEVEGSEPLYMDDETEFRLSCGHVADMVTDCPPAFCPECGARVASDDD